MDHDADRETHRFPYRYSWAEWIAPGVSALLFLGLAGDAFYAALTGSRTLAVARWRRWAGRTEAHHLVHALGRVLLIRSPGGLLCSIGLEDREAAGPDHRAGPDGPPRTPRRGRGAGGVRTLWGDPGPGDLERNIERR